MRPNFSVHRVTTSVRAAVAQPRGLNNGQSHAKYYRSMISFRDQSWNIRDSHRVETLWPLMKFHARKAKAIVWAHNAHVGDAWFTDMRHDGLRNVGQLLRERYHRADEVFIMGFASFEGSVVAGRIRGVDMEKCGYLKPHTRAQKPSCTANRSKTD